MNQKCEMLRHFLAALAYRTQKALRGSTQEFADYSSGNLVRTPKELILHMTSVLGYARTFFVGGSYWPEPLPAMSDEIARFHQMIADLSAEIESGNALRDGMTEERMLQGPLSDAMTHAGQLAMLRRLQGDPVPPENFIVAEIDASRLGPDQPDPVSPDSEWPERL